MQFEEWLEGNGLGVAVDLWPCVVAVRKRTPLSRSLATDLALPMALSQTRGGVADPSGILDLIEHVLHADVVPPLAWHDLPAQGVAVLVADQDDADLVFVTKPFLGAVPLGHVRSPAGQRTRRRSRP